MTESPGTARNEATRQLGSPAAMSDAKQDKPLLDPKELMPAGYGFAIGLLILAGFAVLAQAMGLTLLVDLSAIPRQ